MTNAAHITALYTRVPFRTSGAVLAVVLAAGVISWPSRAVIAQQPSTGRIEGQVRLVVPPAAALPSGVYPSRRVGKQAPKASEISNVVVFLRDMPRQAVPLMHATIVQRDETFVPRVVAITRGSTVDFPNSDPFFHNVFSLSRGASFDLGRFPRGETRSRRFAASGLVKVYCHIHSHMTASIMVFDHPFFRIPAADGTFFIDDVPAGSYQITGWHERIGESTSPIRVEPGRTARAEFDLPVEAR